MHRRKFIKTLAWAGSLASLPVLPQTSLAQSSFNGKLLMTLQLDGGVDVTAFCDPKMNVPGEPEINWWARTDETRTAGNLSYAPFASNQQFFEKYFQDMLVINGVDAQTNSHTVGVVNNWSGRNSEGYPSITSLYARSNAPEIPMAYLNFGGFGATAGLIRSTRIDDISQIRNIIFSNSDRDNPEITHRRPSDWSRIQQFQQMAVEQLIQENDLPAGSLKNREFFQEALERSEGIKAFGNMIPPPEEIQAPRSIYGPQFSTLHQQIQVSLLAFASGVSITADLFEGGFDTHQNNDEDQGLLLSNTTDAIDYLWTFAEELGLADRIVLVIGSDFGRTPHYNSGEGKDHWPIGSNIVMERNASYTNRVMGETDEGHNAHKVNTESGTEDSIDGVIIKPAHVHNELRKYLGIHDNEVSSQFPFSGLEDFAFFEP